jgi:uroporphyrinogen III methyltransferase / synthase
MKPRASRAQEVTPGGKVFFVGAGPGDPGLITVRGKSLIESADAIVYDSLVNSALFPPTARETGRPELVFVGKPKGDKRPPREVISELLVKLARDGKRVVRLTGGDPLVFSGAGEEAEACNDARVEFEVVPGVTAGLAAAAYAGIPVIARGISASVTLVNGAQVAPGRAPPTDWSALARSGGTIILYSAVKNYPAIAAALMKGGMPGEAPAAAIRWGTRARQKTIVATVETLAARMAEQQIRPPAVIVIGWSVVLREELAWFEMRPLFGKRIVVTRAAQQAAALSEKLAELGAEVVEMPATRISRLDPRLLRELLPQLGAFQWLVFTSQNGVEIFWENLLAAGRDARALAPLKVAAVGPATAAALLQRGITVDVIPDRFIAEGLLEKLSQRDDMRGARVLYLSAEDSRETLPDGLRELGADVIVLPIYSSAPEARDSRTLVKRIEAKELDLVTFTSGSTVRAFVAMVGADLAARTPAASIGPQTSEALRAAGIEVKIEAKESTIDGLVSAIVNGA